MFSNIKLLALEKLIRSEEELVIVKFLNVPETKSMIRYASFVKDTPW
jgi:hypothetical protein